MTNNKLPVAGDQFHFLKSGVTFASSLNFAAASEVSRRGQTVTVTDSLIEASLDRDGNSWLSLLDDEDAQIEKWGEVRFALGPAVGIHEWTPGSPEGRIERDRRHALAWATIDPVERAEALLAVKREFPPAMTSRTLSQLDGGR
jgi:hypothetical protein